MGILNTFFLRYRADTGQAVKDIEKLSAAEQKEAKIHEKNAVKRKKDSADTQEHMKKTTETSKKLGESLTQLSEGGTNKLGALRAASSTFSEALGSIGASGAVAAVGIGAVIAAIAVANSGIEDARVAAKEAIELGEKAFDARLAQGELIRLQGQGRARGISDETTSQSAKGVYDRASEIRAAQRQAARDPASAFNNPLIKQANLWKKAGVDVAAGLEKQMTQQDKYLRGLKDAGQEERALVEGTQLFGRTLADVKAVLSTTQKQMDENALAMAKESQVRRGLQTSSESLSTSENKLEAARKSNDERVRQHTVPATDAFTKALTEWEKAVGPLKDAWGEFVAYLINGMAELLEGATSFLRKTGIIDDNRTPEAKIEEQVKAKVALNEDLYGRMKGQLKPSEEGFEAAKAAFLKDIADKERARLTGPANEAEAARKAGLSATAGQAAKELVASGKMTESQAAAAAKNAISQGEKDPSVSKLEDIKTLMTESNAAQAEEGKVQKAQTEYTKKIEANTMALVNTGLEQAMALWAANVGKGAGVGSGSMQGETQIDYEKRVRTMQRTINPNAARKMSMDRAAVGAMSGQAEQLNKAKSASLGNTDQSKTVQIDTLKVEVVSQVQDVAGLAQDVGVSIRDELRYAAAEFASPVVS